MGMYCDLCEKKIEKKAYFCSYIKDSELALIQDPKLELCKSCAKKLEDKMMKIIEELKENP